VLGCRYVWEWPIKWQLIAVTLMSVKSKNPIEYLKNIQ